MKLPAVPNVIKNLVDGSLPKVYLGVTLLAWVVVRFLPLKLPLTALAAPLGLSLMGLVMGLRTLAAPKAPPLADLICWATGAVLGPLLSIGAGMFGR
jgi:hypothetical protein